MFKKNKKIFYVTLFIIFFSTFKPSLKTELFDVAYRKREHSA